LTTVDPINGKVALGGLGSKPDGSFSCLKNLCVSEKAKSIQRSTTNLGIDISHQSHLMISFLYVSLVDRDGVDPKQFPAAPLARLVEELP
jgi:hypothetical protein